MENMKNQKSTKKHTSVVKVEFAKWIASCILVAISLATTSYIYKTDKLPFFGSLYEKEYAQMLEDHKDEIAAKEAEKAEIERITEETLAEQMESNKTGSSQIDLHAILDREHQNAKIKVAPDEGSGEIRAEVFTGNDTQSITLNEQVFNEIIAVLQDEGHRVEINTNEEGVMEININ